MDLELKGKNAVVTAASKGIGRAIALRLAGEGVNVAICARGESSLRTTEGELRQAGVRVFARVCDVGDGDAIAQFLGDARQSFGSVDILVNNASGFGMTDDEAGWMAGMNVDLLGGVRATRIVTPWMADAGGGSIVHISSIAGMENTGSPAAYSAVKAALISHAKTMARCEEDSRERRRAGIDRVCRRHLGSRQARQPTLSRGAEWVLRKKSQTLWCSCRPRVRTGLPASAWR